MKDFSTKFDNFIAKWLPRGGCLFGLIFLVIVAVQILYAMFGRWGIIVPAGLLGALALLAGLGWILYRLAERHQRKLEAFTSKLVCPKCGGRLELTGTKGETETWTETETDVSGYGSLDWFVGKPVEHTRAYQVKTYRCMACGRSTSVRQLISGG